MTCLFATINVTNALFRLLHDLENLEAVNPLLWEDHIFGCRMFTPIDFNQKFSAVMTLLKQRAQALL